MDPSPTNKILSCRLCHQKTPKDPRLLPCLHIFCKFCLLQWASSNQLIDSAPCNKNEGNASHSSSQTSGYSGEKNDSGGSAGRTSIGPQKKSGAMDGLDGNIAEGEELKKERNVDEMGYEVPESEGGNWYEEVGHDEHNSEDDHIYFHPDTLSNPTLPASPPAYLPMNKQGPNRFSKQPPPLNSFPSNDIAASKAPPIFRRTDQTQPGRATNSSYLRMDVHKAANNNNDEGNAGAANKTIPTPPPRRNNRRSGGPTHEQLTASNSAPPGLLGAPLGAVEGEAQPGREVLHDRPTNKNSGSSRAPKLTRRPKKYLDMLDQARAKAPFAGQSYSLDQGNEPHDRETSDNRFSMPILSEALSNEQQNGLEIKIPLPSFKKQRDKKAAANLPDNLESSSLSEDGASEKGNLYCSNNRTAATKDSNDSTLTRENADLYVSGLDGYVHSDAMEKKEERYYNRNDLEKAKDSKGKIKVNDNSIQSNKDAEMLDNLVKDDDDDDDDEDDDLDDDIPAYESFKRASTSESIVKYDSASLSSHNENQNKTSPAKSAFKIKTDSKTKLNDNNVSKVSDNPESPEGNMYVNRAAFDTVSNKSDSQSQKENKFSVSDHLESDEGECDDTYVILPSVSSDATSRCSNISGNNQPDEKRISGATVDSKSSGYESKTSLDAMQKLNGKGYESKTSLDAMQELKGKDTTDKKFNSEPVLLRAENNISRNNNGVGLPGSAENIIKGGCYLTHCPFCNAVMPAGFKLEDAENSVRSSLQSNNASNRLSGNINNSEASQVQALLTFLQEESPQSKNSTNFETRCSNCKTRNETNWQKCLSCPGMPILCHSCTKMGVVHAHHVIASLRELANRDRELVQKLLSKAEPNLSRANEAVEKLRGRSDEWGGERKSAVAAILKQKKILNDLIESYCSEVISKIEAIGAEESDLTSSEIIDSEKFQTSFSDAMEFGRLVLDRGRDSDIVLLSQLIRSRLTDLRACPGQARDRASLSRRELGRTRRKVQFRPVVIVPSDIGHIMGFLSVNREPIVNPEEVISSVYEARVVGNVPADSTATRSSLNTTWPVIEPRLSAVFATRTQTDSKGCKPTGLDVTACDHVVLVDDINKKIKVFTCSGDLRAELEPEAEARLVDPWDVAVLRGGADLSIAVTDRGARDIKIFQLHLPILSSVTSSKTPKQKSKGAECFQFQHSFGKDHLGRPWGVAVNSKNEIFVTDTIHHKVFVFTDQGNLLHTLPSGSDHTISGRSTYHETELMKCPEYIAINHNDDIIVSDFELRSVVVFDIYGRFLYKYDGLSGIGPQLKLPCGLAVDSTGCIYVADFNSGSVVRLSAQGDFLCSYEATDGRLVQPQTLAFNSKKEMILVDRTQVKAFDIGLQLNSTVSSYELGSVDDFKNETKVTRNLSDKLENRYESPKFEIQPKTASPLGKASMPVPVARTFVPVKSVAEKSENIANLQTKVNGAAVSIPFHPADSRIKHTSGTSAEHSSSSPKSIISPHDDPNLKSKLTVEHNYISSSESIPLPSPEKSSSSKPTLGKFMGKVMGRVGASVTNVAKGLKTKSGEPHLHESDSTSTGMVGSPPLVPKAKENKISKTLSSPVINNNTASAVESATSLEKKETSSSSGNIRVFSSTAASKPLSEARSESNSLHTNKSPEIKSSEIIVKPATVDIKPKSRPENLKISSTVNKLPKGQSVDSAPSVDIKAKSPVAKTVSSGVKSEIHDFPRISAVNQIPAPSSQSAARAARQLISARAAESAAESQVILGRRAERAAGNQLSPRAAEPAAASHPRAAEPAAASHPRAAEPAAGSQLISTKPAAVGQRPDKLGYRDKHTAMEKILNQDDSGRTKSQDMPRSSDDSKVLTERTGRSRPRDRSEPPPVMKKYVSLDSEGKAVPINKEVLNKQIAMQNRIKTMTDVYNERGYRSQSQEYRSHQSGDKLPNKEMRYEINSISPTSKVSPTSNISVSPTSFAAGISPEMRSDGRERLESSRRSKIRKGNPSLDLNEAWKPENGENGSKSQDDGVGFKEEAVLRSSKRRSKGKRSSKIGGSAGRESFESRDSNNSNSASYRGSVFVGSEGVDINRNLMGEERKSAGSSRDSKHETEV